MAAEVASEPMELAASSTVSRRMFLARLSAASCGVAAAACGAGAHSHRMVGHLLTRGVRPPGPPVPKTLSEAIRGMVVERGTQAFSTAARVYNERFDHIVPRAVAFPLDSADAGRAIRWLVANDVPFRTRSGGHSYAGYSTIGDGVVLDLRSIGHVHIAVDAATATIGAGAQLIDVYAALARRSRTIPAGSCPSVGIGGHALGGGMGLAGRAFGLTTDNIHAVVLVTADGRVRLVDAHTDPDLFWALRGGGGGNFGVATEFVLRLHQVPSSASWFIVTWPWSLASEAFDAWQMWAPSAPDAITSVFHLETGLDSPVVSTAGQYLGPAAALPKLLSPLIATGGGLSSGEDDYLSLQLRWAGCAGEPLESCHTVGTTPGGRLARAKFWAKSDYVTKALSGQARAALVAAIERKQAQSGSGAILCDSYGGAINRVAPDATAFVHRTALYCIQYLAYDEGEPWLSQTHARMRAYVSGQAYQNYIDPSLTSWRQAYYGANYARLVATQQRVDPRHVFRFPQAIGM